MFFGIRRLFDATDGELPERPAVKFTGACSVVDDPAKNRTVITVGGLIPDQAGGFTIGSPFGTLRAMMSRMARLFRPLLVMLVAAPLIVACARTSLSGAGGASNSASSASGTPSTSGAGSTGGGKIVCAALKLVGPPLAVETLAGEDARGPQLLLSSDDGAEVTIVFASAPVGSPPGAPSSIRHVSFLAWGPWPSGPSLGSSLKAAPLSAGSAVAAQEPGGHFSLLYPHLPSPPMPPQGMFFTALMTPGMDGPAAASVVSPDADHALFIARRDTQRLLGFHRPSYKGWRELLLGYADGPGGNVTYMGPYAESCSSTPPAASAIPMVDGWMLALSEGLGFHGGCLDDVPPGPAVNIETVTYAVSTGLWYFGDHVYGNLPITWLKLAPRSVGAWMAWGEDSGTGLHPIRAARLGPKGLMELPPFAVTADAEAPIRAAAAGLGDDLAVVFVSDPANNPPDLVVKVIGEDGAMTAKSSFEPSVYLTGPVAVLGSPKGDAILAAWQSSAPNSGYHVHVARFDCVGGVD